MNNSYSGLQIFKEIEKLEKRCNQIFNHLIKNPGDNIKLDYKLLENIKKLNDALEKALHV